MLKRDQKRVSKGSGGCQEEARRVKMRSKLGQKGSGGCQDEVKEAQKGVRRGSGGGQGDPLQHLLIENDQCCHPSRKSQSV